MEINVEIHTNVNIRQYKNKIQNRVAKLDPWYYIKYMEGKFLCTIGDSIVNQGVEGQL